MNNPVKELEWFDGSNGDMEGPEAYAFGDLSFFVATDVTIMSDGSKKTEYYGELIFERKGWYQRVEWGTFSLPTIEAAKAACQDHYNELILAGLTDEARAAIEQFFTNQSPQS